MKITANYENKPTKTVNHKRNTNVQFSGLKDKATKCLFVFDLDGTLANGSKEDIQKIIEIAKKRTAKLVYATGRNKKEVESLQYKLLCNNINLPTPDYLISNNGQFLFENINGALIQHKKYHDALKARTKFDSQEVFDTVKKIAHKDGYKFSPTELKQMELFDYKDVLPEKPPEGKNINCFELIKSKDPDFYSSKISHYIWNASEFMSEYFVAASVDLKKLKQNLQNALLNEKDIKTKFIENQYPKKIMDVCNNGILLKSHPLRRHSDGSMTALFLCPADKADGVKYLSKELSIPSEEILIAGNDDNDVSMAKLTKYGSYFICIENSSTKLKTISSSLKKYFKGVFMAKNEGAKGILEGMSNIIEN